MEKMTTVQANNKVKQPKAAKAEMPVAAPVENKVEVKETKTEVPSEVKEEKKVVQLKVKKDEATSNCRDLPLSKKHSMYISEFIKGKKIDAAIKDLEDVIKFKRAIPMRGEIPHRKGKGMMSGRYPIKASQHFITMLKGLKGNAIANGMDLDKTRIVLSSANWASRPQRKGGERFKRTHVFMVARELLSDKKGDKN